MYYFKTVEYLVLRYGALGAHAERHSLALAPELSACARERLEEAKESGESLAPMTEVPGSRGALEDYLAPSLLDLSEYKQVVSLADTLPLSLSGWKWTQAEGVSAETWRAGEGARLILPDPRSVSLGQVISFSSEDPSFEKYEPSGFSSPEPGFTWADGNEASLTLVPDMEEPDSLYFRLTWLMQIGNQYCEIYANDTLVCEADMQEMGNELEFFVSADAWAESGVLTLRFLFPDAMEPGNGDPRLLSVAFESLTLMVE